MDELLKKILEERLEIIRRALSQKDTEPAEKQALEYLSNQNKSIKDMLPLASYYIISKLNEDDKIAFIKDNIDYIRKYDADIFLYMMESPEPLCSFLSFRGLKELYKIDQNIFRKCLNGNAARFFKGVSHEEYLDLYKCFYDEINEMDNIEFINTLYCHSRLCYDNKEAFGEAIFRSPVRLYDLQHQYNEEFVNYVLDNYKAKIDSFSPNELVRFVSSITDVDDKKYQAFINNSKEKLAIAFEDMSNYMVMDYLEEIVDDNKQEILISILFDSIITKHDITKIIYRINTRVVIKLYYENKEAFSKLSLKNWIFFSSEKREFSDEFMKILDTYKVENIEDLFDYDFFCNTYYHGDVRALKYIENKYRESIKLTGVLEAIDDDISIFSAKYFKNLQELREMFKNNSITKGDLVYKEHLAILVLYLKKRNIISDIGDNDFREIDKLFYRIMNGLSMTILYKFSNIQEITSFNRLGNIPFDVNDFTVGQLEKYNVKEHRALFDEYGNKPMYVKDYKMLILKLIFMVGFNRAKVMLKLNSELEVLEHLVGTVDVKNIILDDKGQPILNKKIINLLFNDKEYSRIKDMLNNKDGDLYKYFPRIFNEWDNIKLYNKDKSLKKIIEFLKGADITLTPKYYRLKEQFKFIGCYIKIVNETLLLHDEILKRTGGTIPRVVGNHDGYSYEVLGLHDMDALSVGNKTDCCFTVFGQGYSCLQHATTSKNGRVFVVKKDNEIYAHSWLWRNGDLLCIDNIEISKKIVIVDFLDIYLKLADEMIRKSYEEEGIDSCIKNVTIGSNCLNVVGINNYPVFISKRYTEIDKNYTRLSDNIEVLESLPQPIEELKYSDSKNIQYLIRGNGNFNLFQSTYLYQDARKDVLWFRDDGEYDDNYLGMMSNQINALRYIKYEEEGNLERYSVIAISDLIEAYCNEDWYIITFKDGTVEKYSNSYDERAKIEMSRLEKCKNKVLKKIN